MSRAPSTFDRVAIIVANHFDMAPAAVQPEATFGEDLAGDELDMVELVIRFEEEFGIEIDDDDIGAITTVADAVTLITTKLGGRS